MMINKSQRQSIHGIPRIDLHGKRSFHGKLYVALSRTKNPRNVFILTTHGSNMLTHAAPPGKELVLLPAERRATTK